MALAFWGVQAAAVAGVVWLGFSWRGLVLAFALYFGRMFGLTAGFHRYLAHRSFRTSRAGQFALAFLGTLAVQKGPLWWAAHHRAHHKYSDTPRDIHSVRQNGFWWSHVRWILVRRFDATDWDRIKDLSSYPELVWLNRFYLVPQLLLAVGLGLAFGAWGVVWGFLVSTTMLWHATFCVNSLAHVWGSKRYSTDDDSRNNFFIALATMGEGWHNNHHHYQRSERQGFFWWELDVTHLVLTALSWVGVVWDLHAPPRAVLEDAAPSERQQAA
jgi:stearoyl-CoA desaturase (delta-9 desaturase)